MMILPSVAKHRFASCLLFIAFLILLVQNQSKAQCGTSFAGTSCETIANGFIFDWSAGMDWNNGNPDGDCDQGLYYQDPGGGQGGAWEIRNFNSVSYENGEDGICYGIDANNNPNLLSSGDTYPTAGTWQCTGSVVKQIVLPADAQINDIYYIPIRLEVKDNAETYHYGWIAMKVLNLDMTNSNAIDVDLTQSGATPNPGIVPSNVDCALLPVEFSDISAKARKNQVEINWSTKTEINNDRFEVEFSADGRNFSKVGTVHGAGTSMESNHYSFVDYRNIVGSSAYYRLKQIDYDGQYDYSPVVSVRTSSNYAGQAYLYPNPATKGSVQYQVNESSGILKLKVYSNFGRLIKQTELDLSSMSQSTVEINTTDLAAGVYFVHSEIHGKKRINQLFIK